VYHKCVTGIGIADNHPKKLQSNPHLKHPPGKETSGNETNEHFDRCDSVYRVRGMCQGLQANKPNRRRQTLALAAKDRRPFGNAMDNDHHSPRQALCS
jgi:hypothetical protein